MARAVANGMQYQEAKRLVTEDPNEIVAFVASMESYGEAKQREFVRQYQGNGVDAEIRRWFATQGVSWKG